MKVGIIGYGYWGPKLVRNFAEIPEVELGGIVDRDATRLAKVHAQYPSLTISQSAEDLFLRPDIDAVVVATPIRTHFRLARAALAAGKHVMVEKPLTADADQADELAALADELGLTLMVGHTFQYNPAVRALRDLVASGELGEVYYVDAARLNLGIFQRDINVLWDLAPHDISILLDVLDCTPISVSARGSASVQPGVHDVAYLELRFPDDILAHVHLSWLDPCKVRRVTVVGSKKMVVYNDVSDVEKIRIYDKGVERPYETDKFDDFHLAYRYGGLQVPFIPFDEPLRLQCEHFLACIRTGQRPRSDGHVGAAVVRLLELADRSLHNAGHREDVRLAWPASGRRGSRVDTADAVPASVGSAESH
jgi:predicted dehydrogenase